MNYNGFSQKKSAQSPESAGEYFSNDKNGPKPYRFEQPFFFYFNRSKRLAL